MAMKTLFSPKSEAGKAKGSDLKVANESPQSPPTLYLEHDHLKKLGLDKMPNVGEKLHARIVAHVGAVSEDQDRGDGGNPRRRMTLHVHQMEMGKDGPGKEVDQEEESKKGAKAAMDKALTKGVGSESAGDGEND